MIRLISCDMLTWSQSIRHFMRAHWVIVAEGGVPVLAEKPLAIEEADLERVTATWQATQTPLTAMLILDIARRSGLLGKRYVLGLSARSAW